MVTIISKPIADTPILKGNDAVRFFYENEVGTVKKVSKKERERMKANYKLFKERFV